MISFLLAMDRNGLIGKENDLPWHLPADLKYFKQVTMGHTIIMGRKTYESIGKPLPGRKNVILTHNNRLHVEGCVVVHSVSEALEQTKSDGEIFVIGGANVFKAFYDVADRLYITEIHHEFEGDTYFTEMNMNEWQCISSTEGQLDEKNRYPHTFIVYKRIPS